MRALYLILIGVGFIFLRSGWGKVSGGKFVGSLSGTLDKFASENPNPMVKSFLLDTAKPNAELFGALTQWGELLVGINLIALSLYIIFQKKVNKSAYLLLAVGLFFGLILSLTFWFSAGWMSPSTDGLNLLMAIVQSVGLAYALRRYSRAK